MPPARRPPWALIPGLVLQGFGLVSGCALAFYVSAGIAIAGALVCWVLVRPTDRDLQGPIFSRRSRWIHADPGSTPAITRTRRSNRIHP